MIFLDRILIVFFFVIFSSGILLFGPPGTGKTLMARQIGKMLNAREPKIVNGPQVQPLKAPKAIFN